MEVDWMSRVGILAMSTMAAGHHTLPYSGSRQHLLNINLFQTEELTIDGRIVRRCRSAVERGALTLNWTEGSGEESHR